jgi:rhodanese-related sulfurtransferase
MPERRTIDELLREARARLERLDPEAAFAAMAGGALVVDTRSEGARRQTGVIPGSVHVPLSVLYWRLDPTSGFDDPRLSSDLDRQIVLVCAHGYSSSLAAATLRELGFARATDMVGGFEAWLAAGLPVGGAPG